MIGANFQPQANDPNNGDQRKKPDAGVQEAIKVLSLRLPKVVGAQGIAPSALLNAPGAGGDSRIDSVVNRVLAQYLPTGPAEPGQVPTIGQPSPGESGTMPPSPPVRMDGIPPQTPLSSFVPRREPPAEAPRPPARPPHVVVDRPFQPTPPMELPLTGGADDVDTGSLLDKIRRKNQGGDYVPGGGGMPRYQPGGIYNF